MPNVGSTWPAAARRPRKSKARSSPPWMRSSNSLRSSGGGGAPPNGGACPGGADGNSPGNTNQPSSPQKDSMGGTNKGPGNVNPKDLHNKAENWGTLPPKERTSAKADMIRGLPTTNRQNIEDYIKRIQ